MRSGTHGGVGVKSGDRYAVPLCIACHARQHRIGELTFWSALGILGSKIGPEVLTSILLVECVVP